MALPPRRAHAGYFLLRRWTRVFFSSLRCFFFAIRLRRFLMTEPMVLLPTSLPHGVRDWVAMATPGTVRGDQLVRDGSSSGLCEAGRVVTGRPSLPAAPRRRCRGGARGDPRRGRAGTAPLQGPAASVRAAGGS